MFHLNKQNTWYLKVPIVTICLLMLRCQCKVEESLYRQVRLLDGSTRNLLSDGKVIVLTSVDRSGNLQECSVLKDNSTIPKQLFKEVVASHGRSDVQFRMVSLDVRKLGRKCRKYTRDLKRKPEKEHSETDREFLKRLIMDETIAGTKWCSRQAKPRYLKGLGEKSTLDKCCQEFHSSPDIIPPPLHSGKRDVHRVCLKDIPSLCPESRITNEDRQKRKPEKEPSEAEREFLKRLIMDETIAGTKWCSRQAKPRYLKGLGEKYTLDKCCQEFHSSPDIIPPFTFRHHYLNALPWPIASCETSERLKRCLSEEGSPDAKSFTETLFSRIHSLNDSDLIRGVTVTSRFFLKIRRRNQKQSRHVNEPLHLSPTLMSVCRLKLCIQTDAISGLSVGAK
ncbi:hypothetical protein TNIN_135953 [Trichonephila inaurata madagascariensis]|uniref:Phospholipase A2-like central domain-containing protein n=1 Tax=Trichonephila inaurata madagascariensis TaxID=2747483 RepID=A0A8X6XBU7_9ARAC|nr:hypothetical protein TNIN_135953 [Trichonephila inaurata madagascariensis]